MTEIDEERKEWMAILARSETIMLRDLLEDIENMPVYSIIQPPEVGLVMIQGRIGGDGAAFNLGEMTVTRCVIRDSVGRVGVAYVGGRDTELAKLAATGDLLLQDEKHRDELIERVIVPLRTRQRRKQDDINRKAAATRVEFSNLAVKR